MRILSTFKILNGINMSKIFSNNAIPLICSQFICIYFIASSYYSLLLNFFNFTETSIVGNDTCLSPIDSNIENTKINIFSVAFFSYAFWHVVPYCFQIFHVTKSQIHSNPLWIISCTICGLTFGLSYHNSMLTLLSPSSLQALHSGTHSSSLSTSCILTPYSELTKRLLADSFITCQNQQVAYRSTTTEGTWQKIKVNPLVRYIRTLRWTPIPLGLGFAYIAYQQFRHVKKRESAKISSASDSSELVATNLYVSLYTMLPLRATSRIMGWVHHIDLPQPIRKPLLNFFVSRYGCNLKEAIVEDINSYRSLGEFFGRQLKKEVRPVHPGNCLVSPVDGQVLHFGVIENGLIEQVKGITYSLKSFLGIEQSGSDLDLKLTDDHYQKSLLQNSDNVLYHCVIYLAPGDYHKFHSPAKWTVSQRRHFHGELLSVCPGIVSWVAGLFNINERVVYTGEWQHGFFSLTAVGATNVGSIKVFFDDTLQTNRKKCVKGTYEERVFEPPISVSDKGQSFGEFNLGSTIVLVFEAPRDIRFNVNKGQKIKYGELITLCNNFAVPS